MPPQTRLYADTGGGSGNRSVPDVLSLQATFASLPKTTLRSYHHASQGFFYEHTDDAVCCFFCKNKFFRQHLAGEDRRLLTRSGNDCDQDYNAVELEKHRRQCRGEVSQHRASAQGICLWLQTQFQPEAIARPTTPSYLAYDGASDGVYCQPKDMIGPLPKYSATLTEIVNDLVKRNLSGVEQARLQVNEHSVQSNHNQPRAAEHVQAAQHMQAVQQVQAIQHVQAVQQWSGGMNLQERSPVSSWFDSGSISPVHAGSGDEEYLDLVRSSGSGNEEHLNLDVSSPSSSSEGRREEE